MFPRGILPRGPRFGAALFVALLVIASPAVADGMQVTPIIQALPNGHDMAVYQVRNVQRRPLTVQIQAHRWSQRQGHRVLGVADQLLVVPPLFTLAPGQQQLVRIAYRGPVSDQERDYRVLFREVPERDSRQGMGVGTTVTLDVPLFFLATTPHREVRWQLRSDQGQSWLRITNTGNRYLHLSSLSVAATDGRARRVGRRSEYVLSGNSREWRLPFAPATLKAGLTVRYQEDGRAGSRTLSLE